VNEPLSAAVDIAWEARRLLRAARAATLATVNEGQPFAALVTPATEADLSPLLLLSSLSEHTRHLQADPRCALLVQGEAESANPQTAARLTLTGKAAQADDPGLKARWLARHPYAGFYAGFADFSLWRIAITGAHYVGGFARAARINVADLLPDPAAVAAIADAEASIISHCNSDHADAMDRLAAAGTGWRMVAVDCDGCDLALENQRVKRFPWCRPVSSADAIRSELIALIKDANRAPL
jgi:putative heme iron utilization protein